jgi:sulfatase maturation enzyme AslB (radical SAM superfamily)
MLTPQGVSAKILERDGKVIMEKTCPDHGFVRDLVYSNADLYKKAERWTYEDGDGILNPQVTGAKICPDDCGLCDLHISHAALANVDLTNRCNLRCMYCQNHEISQRDAGRTMSDGYLFEPVTMSRPFRRPRGVPRICQFEGTGISFHAETLYSGL